MNETSVAETRNTPVDGGLSTADLASGADRRPADASAEPQPRQQDMQAEPNGDAPEAGRRPHPPSMDEPGAVALFSKDRSETFKSRWQELQVGFVDEPRQAVERADSLVAEVMQQLAQGFADERAGLEAQWNRGKATETEELRQAFRRYRSFFDRLLTV